MGKNKALYGEQQMREAYNAQIDAEATYANNMTYMRGLDIPKVLDRENTALPVDETVLDVLEADGYKLVSQAELTTLYEKDDTEIMLCQIFGATIKKGGIVRIMFPIYGIKPQDLVMILAHLEVIDIKKVYKEHLQSVHH